MPKRLMPDKPRNNPQQQNFETNCREFQATQPFNEHLLPPITNANKGWYPEKEL
jgi:hypothetical protein